MGGAVNKLLEEHSESVCDQYSISVTKLENNAHADSMDAFKQSFNLSPGKGIYYVKFKFFSSSGKLKYAPTASNMYHHDFFKDQNFNFTQHIEIIGSFELMYE